MKAAEILVVDDEPEMANLVADIAKSRGHRATSAFDPLEAMRLVEDGRFDLVVTDVRMPNIDGIELVDRIARFDPGIAVIAITAFGSIDTAIRAIRAGAFDYLPKPFTPDEMALRIENALNRRALSLEVDRLRAAVPNGSGPYGMVGKSRALADVASLVARVADTPTTVLVTGPSGSGKELVARALHQASSRCTRPFVAINCAAIPENLLEAELFGVRKGAFTDARADRDGVFTQADGGTLFLDEIGELALPLQAKLLRVLQDGEVRALGDVTTSHVEVRVVAATNRDLRAAVEERSFREDLFYRLAVIEIGIPALRSRSDDIVPLAEHFLRRAADRMKKPMVGFSGAAMKRILAYGWPGNVRELENAVERAVALCETDTIGVADLPESTGVSSRPELLETAAERGMTIAELDRAYAQVVLNRVGGSKQRAATLLGIDRRTLQRWFPDGGDAGEGGGAGPHHQGRG